MPAYNAATYLKPCLESVLNQTLTDIEVIVIDDGSTDETLRILADFARVDSRLRILTQQHGYAGRARNRGMDQACGNYLAFLDADDLFAPTFLEQMLRRARQDQLDVTICRSQRLDVVTGTQTPLDFAVRHVRPEPVYSAKQLTSVMFRYSVGWPWDKLFRSEFLRVTALRYPPLATSEDAPFVFMALILAERIGLVDDVLVTHRMGDATSNANSRDTSWHDALTAAQLIEEELRQRGLWNRYRQSYLAWILDFSIWNFETLQGNSQQQFYAAMRAKLLAFDNFPPKQQLFYPYQAFYLHLIRLCANPAKVLHMSRLARRVRRVLRAFFRGTTKGRSVEKRGRIPITK
jgi:glycosyltransferase involved in cell wall biosynthesis